ncbi:MAG: hypothetical protein ABJA80_00345 [bacterium]
MRIGRAVVRVKRQAARPGRACGAARGSVAALLVIASLGACHMEGHGRRVETLLAELAPQLRLGQPLSVARAAMPSLAVRHPGDSPNLYSADDSEQPRVVAVVVWPPPAAGEHASADAVVEGVELVMRPDVAARIRQHITKLFGAPVQSTCAGPTLEQTDLVDVWEVGNRGGALLTIPERRPDGVEPTSRLFIYTSGWEPARSISGFGLASCSNAN